MKCPVSYDGELISQSELGITTNLDDLSAVSTAGSFLPRMQLFGGNSEACKSGNILIGHYGLVIDKDTIVDLGSEVEVLVITGRSKAMQIDGDNIIVNYDRTSQEFNRIAIESEGQDSGCMFGPEFLFYIPSQRAFATFFMSSKTARRESNAVKARLSKAAILTAKLIKGKKFSWHGPKCAALDTPTFELPPKDEIVKQANTFSQTKSSEVEKADSTEERAR